MKKLMLTCFAVLAVASAFGQSIGDSVNRDFALKDGLALKQATSPPPVATPTQPGTGLFAPGKFYSFMGVGTLDGGKKPDYSACLATTLGTYQLTKETYLSVDLLGGFSFTHTAADLGYDAAYNFGGAKWFGHNGPTIGGKVGFVSLYEVATKSGYGLLIGGTAQF